MNEFMGYPLFNGVRNEKLRTYNLANMYMNIKERHGSVSASRYLKRLDTNSLQSVFNLMKEFKEIGFEQVRRNLMRESFK